MSDNKTTNGDIDISSVDYSERVDVRTIHGVVLREKDEPQDGLEPLSLWLVAFCFVVLFFGGFYLALHSGGFRADVYDERFGAVLLDLSGDGDRASVADAAGEQEVDVIALGQRLYNRNCASCHQTTGGGQAGVYPSLVGSSKVIGDGGRMIRMVLHGAAGPWQATSGNYNNAMAAWGSSLSDEQVTHILNYTRQAWGNEAPTNIEPAHVAALREETASRREPYTFEQIMSEPDTLPVLSEAVEAEENEETADESEQDQANFNAVEESRG
ncbi:MAG: c-type cytochrome [Verrucomicrobiales bacterium]